MSNVSITVGKQCNNLVELHKLKTNYFPVWVIDQNENQYRIGSEYKAAAYNKIFEYLVSKGIYAEDYNGKEEKVADTIIEMLHQKVLA